MPAPRRPARTAMGRRRRLLHRMRSGRADRRLRRDRRSSGRPYRDRQHQAMGVLGHGATPAMPVRVQQRRIAADGGCRARRAAGGFACQGVWRAARRHRWSGTLVARFEQASDVRGPCSPPTVADLRSTERAICAINASRGDSLRHRLMSSVRQFRHVIRDAGEQLSSSLFPVQWIAGIVQRRAIAVYQRLRRLARRGCAPPLALSCGGGSGFRHHRHPLRIDVKQLAICLRAASMGIA